VIQAPSKRLDEGTVDIDGDVQDAVLARRGIETSSPEPAKENRSVSSGVTPDPRT